ncbi:MAG: hypothetical protein ABGY96_23360, partial [bacterium]
TTSKSIDFGVGYGVIKKGMKREDILRNCMLKAYELGGDILKYNSIYKSEDEFWGFYDKTLKKVVSFFPIKSQSIQDGIGLYFAGDASCYFEEFYDRGYNSSKPIHPNTLDPMTLGNLNVQALPNRSNPLLLNRSTNLHLTVIG